jgi:hypothetical protein
VTVRGGNDSTDILLLTIAQQSAHRSLYARAGQASNRRGGVEPETADTERRLPAEMCRRQLPLYCGHHRSGASEDGSPRPKADIGAVAAAYGRLAFLYRDALPTIAEDMGAGFRVFAVLPTLGHDVGEAERRFADETRALLATSERVEGGRTERP